VHVSPVVPNPFHSDLVSSKTVGTFLNGGPSTTHKSSQVIDIQPPERRNPLNDFAVLIPEVHAPSRDARGTLTLLGFGVPFI
jgi:hypothetical protein